MSIEMADTNDYDHSALQEVANAVRESSGADDLMGGTGQQKRKRELSDQGSESADAARRGSKARIEEHGKENDDGVNAFKHDPGNAFMEQQQQHEGNAGVNAIQEYSNLHEQSLGDQNGAQDHANASSTAAAALGIYPTMSIPQPTNLQFQTQDSQQNQQQQNQSFMDNGPQDDSSYMDPPSATPQGSRSQVNKPAVGSEEWHKVRKDNHKEVERRRRETINEGINELAKIVPGCEKNKGSILQRAVQFITQLKENEDQNIEKWTLEKLLTEQAIAELSASNDKLKAECERAWREVETWKKTCMQAGLEVKKDDGGQ